jgi:glucokinase
MLVTPDLISAAWMHGKQSRSPFHTSSSLLIFCYLVQQTFSNTHMQKSSVIGIDLGGTNVRAALVSDDAIEMVHAARTPATSSYEEVLQTVFRVADATMRDTIVAIGIGVPSVVDVATGTVYDVQNIPAWKEVPLKDLMEQRYGVPVFVNNDANCFALGEFYFGQGRGSTSMIGLTIGTGLGAGIIINKKLYAGSNCGAGEFGMVAYRDEFYEWYASGQFFKNEYDVEGGNVYKRALYGEEQALKMYREFGMHLGNALKMILYTYDPNLIVLGGSVAQAYELFQTPMWQQLQTFAYPRSVPRLQIRLSSLQKSGVLGAAALYYDAL